MASGLDHRGALKAGWSHPALGILRDMGDYHNLGKSHTEPEEVADLTHTAQQDGHLGGTPSTPLGLRLEEPSIPARHVSPLPGLVALFGTPSLLPVAARSWAILINQFLTGSIHFY